MVTVLFCHVSVAIEAGRFLCTWGIAVMQFCCFCLEGVFAAAGEFIAIFIVDPLLFCVVDLEQPVICSECSAARCFVPPKD